jgi:hypothetical protein
MSSECVNFFKWCCMRSVTLYGTSVYNTGQNTVTGAIYE